MTNGSKRVQGRFAKGNPGGPGRPRKTETAEVRKLAAWERGLRRLYRRALALLQRAEDLVDASEHGALPRMIQARSSALHAATAAAREVREDVELMARAAGDLQPNRAEVQVQVFESPEWVSLQGRIVAALGPFTEARQAVLAALRGEPIPLPASAHAVALSGASGTGPVVEPDRKKSDDLKIVREARRDRGTH